MRVGSGEQPAGRRPDAKAVGAAARGTMHAGFNTRPPCRPATMSLVRFDDVSLELGEQRLLRQANLLIEPGERVCLIGRNGAGKTSLFRLITGELLPDEGQIRRRADLQVSQLDQALPDALDMTVPAYVETGLAALREIRDDYQGRVAETLDKHGLRELEALHQRIDALDGWHLEQRVESMVTDLGLPAERSLGELSGGWRRRVGLARALVSQPDLLLLDEPTNHLDLATIAWLESRIRAYPGSVLFITHDRAFVQNLATRIVEIDRGQLVSWPGSYRDYLKAKEKALEEEARNNAEFDKRLAEEEAWIRQGIKARRTRNEGRVRALEAMREEHAARIGRPGQPRIRIGESDKSGRKVIQAHKISYGYDGEPLIDDLSLKVMRGARIGLVGNNGVGKSTLLRLLLGDLQPQSGTVKHGTHLEIGYFDPLKSTLEEDKSVAHNVGDGRDYVMINGKQQHVVGYLTGFLFSAKRALTPVKALSGGERNRVTLARLFTQPSNLLVLDEPTNDLDVETLEVLEARLAEYAGTLIVVSHDRLFLDNVVTSIFAFEESGQIVEHAGGYSDWARRGRSLREMDDPLRRDRQAESSGKSIKPTGARTKLSYREQRELEALPAAIEALEATVATLQGRIADTAFYGQSYEETKPVLDELAARTAELDAATERWLALEDLQASLRDQRPDRAS